MKFTVCFFAILIDINAAKVIKESIEVPVDTEACNKQLTIFDSGGSFVKTACYVASAMNYEGAASFCQHNNMKLYKFDTIESYDGWLRLADSLWMPFSRAAVWVNGRRRYNCSGRFKIVENLQRTSLGGNVHYEDLHDCGICLVMHNSYGQFKGSPEACSNKMTFFCESINHVSLNLR
jgi:hypothetical protein